MLCNLSKACGVFMCLVSAASAGTLVGGGATLPVVGLTGAITGAPITATSLFGVYINVASGNAVSYCPTGSVAGKKILAANDPTNYDVNFPCNSALSPPFGFGGSGLVQPHFVASDSPLSLLEYNDYTSSHGFTARPTQLPAIAGAIGIVFKKTGVNSLTLNEDQICGIFSGQIRTWQDLAIAGAVGLPAGTTGSINVVFSAEGSGTSFSFLNHLSAVCPSVGVHTATNFHVLESYATGAAAYLPSYASSVAGNGDAGVVAAVAGTVPGAPMDGSIGYAAVANGVRGGVRMASVTNQAGTTFNPLTGFGPTAIPVTLTFDKVSSNGGTNLVSVPTPSNGCIAVVDPVSYANPVASYPIVAIVNLLGNNQGNGSDVAAVRSLLGMPYNTAIRSSVTTIGRVGTGYAWLSNADLTQARVNACIN